jgi:SpoVK/Ycf46/Vps4 family AAA+-type ATPase
MSYYKSWECQPGDRYFPVYSAKPKLEPAFYCLRREEPSGTCYLQKQRLIFYDQLLELPMPEIELIYQDLQSFWAKEKQYAEYHMLYKRGILLHGAPGTGKSYLIHRIIRYVMEQKDGIVINLKSQDCIKMFYHFVPEVLREVEPDRHILVVMEDFESLCENQSGNPNTLLLNFLDGVKSINRVVYLATTNFPERLEKNIFNRPGRFDKVQMIGLPCPAVRRMYVQNKLSEGDLKSINLDEWVERTEGLTIAHLKELIISVKVLGQGFDETLDMLVNMKIQPSSRNTKAVGFNQ